MDDSHVASDWVKASALEIEGGYKFARLFIM